MTTIACDGKSMAGDGLCADQWDMVCDTERRKVFRLADGRIIGAAGNSFDAAAWKDWLVSGKEGPCPIQAEQFSGLILNPDGTMLWVDGKGREIETPTPCAIGSGQDIAMGAMLAGATTLAAVMIAIKRDIHSGGTVQVEVLESPVVSVAA